MKRIFWLIPVIVLALAAGIVMAIKFWSPRAASAAPDQGEWQAFEVSVDPADAAAAGDDRTVTAVCEQLQERLRQQGAPEAIVKPAGSGRVVLGLTGARDRAEAAVRAAVAAPVETSGGRIRLSYGGQVAVTDAADAAGGQVAEVQSSQGGKIRLGRTARGGKSAVGPTEPGGKPSPARTGSLKVPPDFKAAAGTQAEPYTKTGWAQEIVNARTGIALVYVPAGEFLMGSPGEEKDRDSNEVQHRVTLTQGFYLGKHEVTQKQWEAVMGINPSEIKGPDNPVERVSWDDCQTFIKRLNTTLNRAPGTGTQGLRLPTEAEWEYACRAGTKGPFHYGDSLEASQANFDGHYPYGNGRKGENRQSTTPVGAFTPNAWGLYDMHGNVCEWCSDWLDNYPPEAVTDPAGPEAGPGRVYRGGSWVNFAESCRSATRFKLVPEYLSHDVGCRLALSPVPAQ